MVESINWVHYHQKRFISDFRLSRCGKEKEDRETGNYCHITQLRKYQKLHILGKIGEWAPKY